MHSDLNNFYASVELLKRPEYKDVPVIVTGSKEDRHGIVLAKNYIAKSFGVKTGEVIWEAERKCKNLVSFPADFASYVRISEQVRNIYARFTDKIEPFGIDECWLDVTDSEKLFGGGESIAQQIRAAVKEEIGITVSVGVSYNKVFAKLGSDMKKPDAVTVISKDNYKDTVWKLPVEDLLFVGKATKRKLNSLAIYTIGDLAKTEEKILRSYLGIWGTNLHRFACGEDDSPVEYSRTSKDLKSIGNSLTNYRDAETVEEVETLILLLSESVAARLRESGLGKAKTVVLSVEDNSLKWISKQTQLDVPSKSAVDIAKCCYRLFRNTYTWEKAVRGVGVAVRDFTMGSEQLTVDFNAVQNERFERLDDAVDGIRRKYGNTSVLRARILQDKRLSAVDVKSDHPLKPENKK